MCVSCREFADKQQLLRVARTKQGQAYADLGGRIFGRGAYICINEKCLQKAQKRHILERVLKIKTEDSLWQQLWEETYRRGSA